ncbi:MAG: carboxypeptidase regulatory-like domain-containing protein [Chitinophagaceae bacterium]|nr:MAG: carboxypeptidase regulatory-like domain-containing protein [Chitinophagaceae bacterium]
MLLVLGGFRANAQPCLIQITNNAISIQPALCSGTVATLQGSTPLGGNGSYTYQWQKSVGNCNAANFQPIPNATSKDYPVPAGTDPNDCFRRVVTSGTCTHTSNTTKVLLVDRTTPSGPATMTTPSSCATASGSISVTSPVPGANISYTVTGTNYNNTNSTGIFSSLAPGIYNVTVKYPSGCLSPVTFQTVAASQTVSGTITPSSASICQGDTKLVLHKQELIL